MAVERVSIMGRFGSDAQAAAAIRALRATSYDLERIHSPIPSHAIADALQLPKSKVGWFTLAGGIAGFFSGFLLAAFTATRWSLIVGGKPIVALVPFTIVGFEFTILFAVFGNVLGLISQARLPRFKIAKEYEGVFSADRFGLLVNCRPEEERALADFLKARGAEISTGAAEGGGNSS